MKIRVLLIATILLAIAIIRIETLRVHMDLPRPSNHQDGYFDYEGEIHWHTDFTWGALGTYEQLAALGNQNLIDFMITTEHNNLFALKNHKEGWHGRMLTLVGVESSRQEGYLLGLNIHRYTFYRGVLTSEFLADVARQGGFTVIAHPDNPRWRWHGKIDPRMAGQEIMDLTDQFNTASAPSLLTGLLYYPFNIPAAYLQMYHRPTGALKMWDEQTSRRHFIGIYAPDAHGAIKINTFMIAFPNSLEVLSIAHDHVVSPAPFTGDFKRDKTMLYDAIEKGRIYVALDILQDATGFFFSARQNGKTAWMGDELPAGPQTDFLVKLPQPLALKDTVINVYHNGEKIASSKDPEYAFRAALPGAYRIEVEAGIPTFWGFGKSVVWIYSNPIYLR